MPNSISLTQHTLGQREFSPKARGEFSTIMTQIALGGKMIAQDLRRVGLLDILGATGEVNVQGEEVQKLDKLANDTFVRVLESSRIVRVVISEEMEKPYMVVSAEQTGNYAVFFDPLDGSSNVDINAPLGSIFSIHRFSVSSSGVGNGDYLKPGIEQVAGGYILYGASTNLVYTCGDGVHLFTLNPDIGEFLLTTSHITIPARGKIYSVNEGNCQKWSIGMKKYIDYLQKIDSSSGRPYSLRYTGCLVADVHRVLLKGGLYLYPGEVKKPEGKLRLMYEAAPLTFVIEQAGGVGSTGFEKIRTIQPKTPHERVPLVIGSRDEVELAEQFFKPEIE